MLKKMKNTDITLIILTAVCCIGGILLTFSMAYNSKYQNITSGNPSSSWKTTLIAAAIDNVGFAVELANVKIGIVGVEICLCFRQPFCINDNAVLGVQILA